MSQGFQQFPQQNFDQNRSRGRGNHRRPRGSRNFQGGRAQPQGQFGFQPNPQFQQQSFLPQQSRGQQSQRRGGKLCRDFHQNICQNGSCQFMHQWNFENDLIVTNRIVTGLRIFQATYIPETQVAIVTTGKIMIIDLVGSAPVADFVIQGKLTALIYTPSYPDGTNFLLFGGLQSQISIFGGISNKTNTVEQFQGVGHQGQIQAINFAPNGYILTGDQNGNIGIWYFNNNTFSLGIMLSNYQAPITSIQVINNYILASTQTGVILGWNYDFATNTNEFLQHLTPTHQGAASQLLKIQERYLVSCGEDGMVYCWDSQGNFSANLLCNASEKKPTKLKSVCISESSNNEQICTCGTLDGRLLTYKIAPDNKFKGVSFPFNRAKVISLLNISTQGQKGFIAISESGDILVFNWQ